MLTDGLRLSEGSVLVNPVVQNGTSFPVSPDAGELFYRSDLNALHIYNGLAWVQVGLTSSQLEGQPGSYYLDLANHTGVLDVDQGGTGQTTLSGIRSALGLVIGSTVQAWDADLDSIAGLAGTTGFLTKTAANTWALDTGSYQPLDGDLTAIAGLAGTSGFLKKTAANTWALDTTSYLSTSGGSVVGNISMTGNIIPTADNTYSLGDATHTWKDVYVGPGSLYVNGKEVISDQSNTMVFSTDLNQNLRVETSGTGNLELQAASSGAVLMKATMTLTSGKRILDSAGIQVEFGDDIQMNSNKVIGLAAPSNPGDATNKTYVDTFASNASNLTSGTIPNARIQASGVTQHQASLSIAETQIPDGTLLARVGSNETVTGTWTFNNAVTVATPTADSHAATKLYVDNVAAGVNPHEAVRVATTGNISLAGTQTIDGVAVVAGDRVLAKDQTAASTNGIYVVAAGAWTRATDFDGSPTAEVATGDLVFVSEGTTNANTSFVLVTTGTITVGTTNLTFSVFSRAGDIIAGAGLTRTGQTIDAVGASGRIVVNADNIDLATAGTSGTYRSVTTDAYGRVTSGSNPTTLAGYGITDAQALDSDLTALAGLSTTGVIIRTGSGTAATRSIAVSGTGLSITNGDGLAGNPTVVSNATDANTASAIVARDASGNFTAGTITAALSGNATTATTLQNARTINGTSFNGSANITITANTPNSLTFNNGGAGAASGTTFNGGAAQTISYNSVGAPSVTGANASGTWGINITGNAASADAATLSQAIRTYDATSAMTGSATRTARSADTVPNQYLYGVYWDFKNASVVGGAGNYAGLLTLAPWQGNTSSTGDPSYSLAFSPAGTNSTAAPTLKIRAGIDTTWGSWSTILHSSNYNSYAPTLTGTGASGTWSINVTGNAGTVDGFDAQVAQAANTIPVRDGNGYVFLSYINSSTGNSENPTISQVITTNGGDNYYRKSSIGHLANAVAAQSVAPTGTWQFTSTGSVGANTSAPLQAYATTGSGNGAWMSFHRAGAYAVNMGLDSDNVFRLGGWSDGAGVYRFQVDAAGVETKTASAYIDLGRGLTGGYATITSSGSGWGSNIFGIGPAYIGTGSGNSYALGNNYGMVWLRGSHASANSNIGEGMYLYTGGTLQGGIGTAGLYANGTVKASAGMYPGGSSTNFIAGQSGTYGTMNLQGTTGGYHGFYLPGAAGTTFGMYDTSGNGGAYDTTTGWHFYWLRANACLGIGGSSTSASYKAYVNGALYASGDITAFSDRRVKTNITVIDDALNKVLKLNGVTFNWNDEKNEQTMGKASAGLIAQEVEEVLPEAVHTDEETGMKGVSYNATIGLLVEAIKTLNAKIEVLEAKLAEKE